MSLPIASQSDAAHLARSDLLTQRTALAVDKLAALMPVQEASQGNVQSSTEDTVQARLANAANGPGTGDPRLAGQGGSTRETLSFAARAILDLFEGGDAQPLRNSGPLLPSAPGAGSPATATLSNALAALVDQSGMFYESHVAQWVAGQRPLAALLQEPQAALRLPTPATPQAPANPQAAPQTAGAPVALLPYGGPAAPATTAPPSATLLAELTRPVIYPLTTGVPTDAPQAGQPGQAQGAAGNAQNTAPHGTQGNPQLNAHAAQGNATPAEQRRAAHASAAAQAYQITAEVSHEGHHAAQAQRAAIIANWNAADATPAQPRPDAGPPVHPAAEGVVRQQLELLATQQFRCAIEAWPGMPFEWEVSRDAGHADAPDAAQWSTRVRLDLPQLGNIDAVLTLTPQGLDVRMIAAETDAVAQLMQGRADFRSQLDARGIALLNVAVHTRQEAPEPDPVEALS